MDYFTRYMFRYGMGYYNYWLFLLPALLLALFAQVMVSARYNRYSKVMTTQRVTGREVARKMLEDADIGHVAIQPVKGKMTDHYHPKHKTIYLSEGVYDSCSIAAIGIAAHEAGHAVQHAKGYAFLRIRTTMVPVCNVASSIGLPLAIIGYLLDFAGLVMIGLILFAGATLFHLVTLPVEFNASRRALAFVKTSGYFFPEEHIGAKKVLTAAALTYVAAMIQSIMQLLYYAMRFTGNRRN